MKETMLLRLKSWWHALAFRDIWLWTNVTLYEKSHYNSIKVFLIFLQKVYLAPAFDYISPGSRL